MHFSIEAIVRKSPSYVRHAGAATGCALGLLVMAGPAVAQTEITPPASAVSASTNDGNLPGNAVDDNLTTRWSANGDGAWLQLDLGSVRPMGHVRVAFFNGNLRRSRFDLQVATISGAWSNVLTNVESGGTTTAEETFDFADTDARWVRYVGHGNNDPAKATWNSVSEISLFSPPPTPTPAPTSTPDATATPTSTPTPTMSPDPTGSTPTPTPEVVELTPPGSGVSASTNDGNLPANTVDGGLATRWSGNGDGAWIQYDLGIMRTIAYVKIAVYNGNNRQNRFDLQVSGSGSGPWTNVLTNALTSGTTTQLETHDIGGATARFVRYVGHMSNVGTFNSLTEVELWGTPCTGCATPTPTPMPTVTPTAVTTPTPTPTAPAGGCLRIVNVSTSSALASAVSGAVAGDCIVVADGSYSAFTVTADGTSANPIVIRAANRGLATISSGILRIRTANHVTVDGFRITSGGGSTTLDGETRSVIVSFDDSNNCRLTRCNFKPSGHANGTGFVMLNGNSNFNRIDHNDFGPNTVDGVHYVWPLGNRVNAPGSSLSRETWANGGGVYNPEMARDTRVDHNYFHDMASGTAECVVLGGLGTVGDYQELRTVVEYNLFTNCDGDPEIISMKSSANVIRYNTVRTSNGGIVARAGNKGQIYGNFILQGQKSGGAGVRVYEMDHRIFNNYIDGARTYPILLGSGDCYTCSFSHAQTQRALVVHNTVVNMNNEPIAMGFGTHTLAPKDCVVANNILTGSAPQMIQHIYTPINMTYSNNVAWPTAGSLGISATPGQWWVTNPQLTLVDGLLKLSSASPAVGYANALFYSWVTDDMDGQTRDDPDSGADEVSAGGVVRRPLTTADVGPNAP